VIRQDRINGGQQAYWCCGQCSALRSDLAGVPLLPSAHVSVARAAETQRSASRRAVKETAQRRAELVGAYPAASPAVASRLLCAPGRRAREAGDYRCAGSWWYRS